MTISQRPDARFRPNRAGPYPADPDCPLCPTEPGGRPRGEGAEINAVRAATTAGMLARGERVHVALDDPVAAPAILSRALDLLAPALAAHRVRSLVTTDFLARTLTCACGWSDEGRTAELGPRWVDHLFAIAISGARV